MVDQSSPVTTSEKQAVPVAQEILKRLRKMIGSKGELRFTLDPDFNSFGKREVETIKMAIDYLASLPCKSGEGAETWTDGDILDFRARFYDDSDSRSLGSDIRQTIRALRAALSTPSEQFAKSSPDAEIREAFELIRDVPAGWKTRGYDSELEEVRAMAQLGRASMAPSSKGWI